MTGASPENDIFAESSPFAYDIDKSPFTSAQSSNVARIVSGASSHPRTRNMAGIFVRRVPLPSRMANSGTRTGDAARSEEPTSHSARSHAAPSDFFASVATTCPSLSRRRPATSTGEASAEQPDSDVTVSDHTDSSQEVSEETDAELDEEIRSVMEEEEEKLSFSQKIKLFFEKIKLFISNCKKKCYNIYDSFLEYKKKIERISKEIKYYYKVINHPAVKAAWEFLLKKLKKVWRNVRPRKIRIWVRYGADDPAQTMKMYGYYCMLAPFTGKAIRFEAVTDEVVFLAEGKVRGRFQVYRFLLTAWSLFFNRNCRKVIKLLRREGKKRGR